MKPDRVTAVALTATVGVFGFAWLFLPSLQASQRRADAEASRHLERARRLLHLYNADLAYRALLLDQLRDADVDVDIADPQALVEDAGDQYQERHTDLWEAFEPKDWTQDPPRPVRPGYSNVAGQIREGVKGRSVLIAANGNRLKDAHAEIEKALSVTSGSASASSHFEAGRLKGVIQYHRGLAERVRAILKRAEAERYRLRLDDLANGGVKWASSQTLVADSGIDEQIRRVHEKAAQVESELDDNRKALEALETTIDGLEKRLIAARLQADQARAAMEELKSRGVDFSDAHGAENFAQRYTDQDTAYREALREVQSLEAGGFPTADIDPSGDFLKGRYLENGSAADLTIEHGLAHYRNERIVLAAKVESEERMLADFRSDLSRLEGIKAANQAAQTDAAQRIAQIASLATEAYNELNRVEAEAEVIEDAALKLLDQSVSASQQAAGAVDEWTTYARERTQNLSAETKDRSAFSARENDDWMAGHIAAQAADARLAKAWIYYGRFAGATQNAAVLARATQSLRLKEADPEIERVKSQESRAAGIEEVTMAMEVLEKAHRRTERHWTLAAQAAGTTYLLALFGQPEYAAEAIEGYRYALKGRESEKYTEKLAARLKRLESR